MHTCDKFKKGTREAFFSFQVGFSKIIEYIGKLSIQVREISKFCKKVVCFRRNLRVYFRDDQGGFTYMIMIF